MISETSCCCKRTRWVQWIYNVFEIYASRNWSNTLLLSRSLFFILKSHFRSSCHKMCQVKLINFISLLHHVIPGRSLGVIIR